SRPSRFPGRPFVEVLPVPVPAGLGPVAAEQPAAPPVLRLPHVPPSGPGALAGLPALGGLLDLLRPRRGGRSLLRRLRGLGPVRLFGLRESLPLRRRSRLAARGGLADVERVDHREEGALVELLALVGSERRTAAGHLDARPGVEAVEHPLVLLEHGDDVDLDLARTAIDLLGELHPVDLERLELPDELRGVVARFL